MAAAIPSLTTGAANIVGAAAVSGAATSTATGISTIANGWVQVGLKKNDLDAQLPGEIKPPPINPA